MRKKTNKTFDKKHFTRTASHTKDVNLSEKVMRGGIRF